mgnify:FL=1
MNSSKIKTKTGIIAVYVMALMLVGLGYWNYISVESKNIQTVAETQEEKNAEDENLGDAQLVSSNDVTISTQNSSEDTSKTQSTSEIPNENEDNTYFEESKLQRDTMYSQTLETYKEMLNNSNVSEEQKAVITQEITNLSKEKNSIMVCENLITTKGFSNCVIFVNTDSISVVIESDELKTDEIAQIQNIISREMNAKVEDIHIMTKN